MLCQLLLKNLGNNECPSFTAAKFLGYHARHAHSQRGRTGLDAHTKLVYDVKHWRRDPQTSLGHDIVSSSVKNCNARSIFDGSICKTSSTAQLNAHLKCGQSRQALALYQKLQNGPSNITVYISLALLKACAKLKNPAVGADIHAELARKGVIKGDSYVCNTLVYMYAACASLGKAQEVFDSSTARDVVTWTALIGGYAQHRRGHEALYCFELMCLCGVPPNELTYACCLKACGSIGAVKKGRCIHANLESNGLLETNQFVGNALVDMYAKCGMLSQAKEAFEKLPHHDTVSWNTLITGYIFNESAEDALLCFKAMQAKGVSPDETTFTSSLKACAALRASYEGIKIHEAIDDRNFLGKGPDLGSMLVDMYAKCGMISKAQDVFDGLPVRDVVTWTALIGGYVQYEQGEAALHFFECMQLEGRVSSDPFLFACVLKACGNTGALAIAEDIHEELIKRRLLVRDLALCNALIDMYAKCGSVRKAREVFETSFMWDTASWNSLISGYSLVGEVESVWVYLDRMMAAAYDPNLVTFVGILSACSHVGLLEEGKFYFKAMEEVYGITPAAEHYTCIVDLLGRAGQVDLALVLMKNSPFHFDTAMWLTVLGACRKWGDADLGRQAFEAAMGVDETDAAAYVCMYNICSGTDNGGGE